MTPSCPTCGQPLPDQARRDPPLAPLEQPNVVTIHDLPVGERARAEVVNPIVRERDGRWGCSAATFRTPRDVVDGREGGR